MEEKRSSIREKEDWWESVSYEDAKTYIKDNVRTMARSFIAVGYYLKQIRDRALYREDGYASIWDFARETYGMSRTTASRWMEMNDRFSENGNSPILEEKYQEFGKSQLQEMLYLPEEKLEKAKPEMTVAQIRGLKDQEKKREEEEAEADPLPPCIMGRSETGSCEAAAYCIDGRECCTGCEDGDCPIRCEHADIPKEPDGRDTTEQSEMNPDQDREKRKQEQEKEICATSHTDKTPEAGQEEVVRHALNVIEHAAGTQRPREEYATSHTENVVDLEEEEWEETSEDVEEEEEPEEDQRIKLTPEKLLEEKMKELKEMEVIFGDEPEEDHPRFIAEGRIVVEALTLLVEKREAAAGQEELPQLELPGMKNNDQRKAWLKEYQDWGLWYEDKNLGVKYYKYDFENGARLIVEEYEDKAYCGEEFKIPYFHLIGGPEPPKMKYGYGKWTRHERYSKHPDSETELVEFLKFVQRRN